MGGAGNDILFGATGNDVIIGGDGNDTVDINADIASGQAANLTLRRVGTQIFGLEVTGPASLGVDRFYSVEKANLTGYADKLTFTQKFAVGIDANVIFDGKAQPAVANDFGCVFLSERKWKSLVA